MQASDYGAVVFEVSGQGGIKLPNGSIGGDFTCKQIVDSRIFFELNAQELRGLNSFSLHEVVSSEFKLYGQTSDGYTIDVQSPQFIHFEGSIPQDIRYGSFVFLASEVKIYNPNHDRLAGASYSVVNSQTPILSIDFERFQAIIIPVPDYKKRVSYLRLQGGVFVTTKINLVRINADIAELNDSVDIICRLLSIVSSSRVEWILCKYKDKAGVIFQYILRRRITRSFGREPLISQNRMEPYLRAAFPNFTHASKDWNLPVAIDILTEAMLPQQFIELRGLKLAICMEHLKNAFLTRTNRVTIINANDFSKCLGSLKSEFVSLASKAFSKMSPQDTDIKMMSSHLQGINYYPFGRALKLICDCLGLKKNSDERYQFKNIRDSLVHYSIFPNNYGVPSSQLNFMISFVSDILLATLGYKRI